MRTLVTGGAGFIGSHLADAACTLGHEVMVIDNLSRGHRRNLPAKAHFHALDITSEEALQVLTRFQPDAVFHFAAQMDVRKSVADPIFDAQVNVLGTIAFAKAAAESGCQLFAMASTGGAIYGEQSEYPAPESHPCRSDSPYGLSKLSGEHYLDYFSRTSSMRTAALRLANVYGPRQDPHGEAGVVAIFSQKMLANEQPTIFGDGGQTRDYVYVGDVVAAFLSLLDNPAAHGAINIGTAIETDVNELARLIREAAEYDGQPNYAPAKPGEQRRSVISYQRATEVLGWQPKVSLEAGLKKTVDWFAQTP